jgi:hypothetical protein
MLLLGIALDRFVLPHDSIGDSNAQKAGNPLVNGNFEPGPEIPKRPGDPPRKKRVPVASKGSGTLKGRVTLAGDPPNIKALTVVLRDQMKANPQDGQFCLSGSDEETSESVWEPRDLKKGSGVKNVFVWLQPADENHFFAIDMKNKTWPDKATIDQPHCAFLPHASILFPGSYEGGEVLQPSGQFLEIKNSAPINHNTHWSGGDLNPGRSILIAKGAKPLEIKDLVPSPEPLIMNCDIHKWMSAVVRVFDHPYAALTDKDGNFEIKNAPAGVELRVVVWHEGGKFGSTGKKGDKVTLEDGKTTEKNYTVSAH